MHLWYMISRMYTFDPSPFFGSRNHRLLLFPHTHFRRRSTYNHLSSWLTDARNLTNPNTCIFLIGNKSDLEAQRDVTYDEAKQFAEENGLMFIEASAKTGEGVEEAFLETAKRIYQNIQDGSLDLNAAESGVQHKPTSGPAGPYTANPNASHRLGGSASSGDGQSTFSKPNCC